VWINLREAESDDASDENFYLQLLLQLQLLLRLEEDMNKVFQRDYHIKLGILTVKIFYYDTSIHNYFNPPSIGDVIVETGYEDDDQLTFYPNILTLSFLDHVKINYNILKNSFNQTPNHNAQNYDYLNKHSVQLFLNGNGIFSGYIDKESLDYDSDSRYLKFEVIDYMVLMRNLTCPHPGPPDWAGSVNDIWYQYRQAYPGLSYTVTNNLAAFRSPGFNGIYLKHNWEFNGEGNIGNPDFNRSFDIDIDPTGYDNINWFRKYLFEASSTMAEYMRRTAHEIGAVIGVEAPNKIFIVKRFSSFAFTEPELLNPKLISYKKFTHLKNILGVRTKLLRTGWYISHGEVHTVGGAVGAAFDDTSLYLDIEVVQGRCTGGINEGDNGPGSYRIYSRTYGVANDVLNGVYDPELNIGYDIPQRIIGEWTYRTRRFVHDRFETKCTGVDFSPAQFYTINENNGVPSAPLVLRPIVIRKNYTKHSTELMLLEVGQI